MQRLYNIPKQLDESSLSLLMDQLFDNVDLIKEIKEIPYIRHSLIPDKDTKNKLLLTRKTGNPCTINRLSQNFIKSTSQLVDIDLGHWTEEHRIRSDLIAKNKMPSNLTDNTDEMAEKITALTKTKEKLTTITPEDIQILYTVYSIIDDYYASVTTIRGSKIAYQPVIDHLDTYLDKIKKALKPKPPVSANHDPESLAMQPAPGLRPYNKQAPKIPLTTWGKLFGSAIVGSTSAMITAAALTTALFSLCVMIPLGMFGVTIPIALIVAGAAATVAIASGFATGASAGLFARSTVQIARSAYLAPKQLKKD